RPLAVRRPAGSVRRAGRSLWGRPARVLGERSPGRDRDAGRGRPPETPRSGRFPSGVGSGPATRLGRGAFGTGPFRSGAVGRSASRTAAPSAAPVRARAARASVMILTSSGSGSSGIGHLFRGHPLRLVVGNRRRSLDALDQHGVDPVPPAAGTLRGQPQPG